jgi:dolichol-phosphate mannosyltransferase
VRVSDHNQSSDQPTEKPLVSIVIPAYNEQDNLPELFDRVTAVLDGLPDYRVEILLIDNCSRDDTGAIARRFTQRDTRWRYLRFSRNFGCEVSLAAGLYYAQGDALIFLQSDLQDPPEAIPTMLARWRQGYDVVYGQLTRRSDDSFLKTLGARVAYRLIHWLSDVKIPPHATDFRLISRPAVEALKRCGERNRYLRGLVHWVGFRQCGFTYERAPRKRGRTTTGLIFCFNYAINALVAFSSRPLRWASALGVLVTAASVFGAAAYVALTLLNRAGVTHLTPPPAGWMTQTLLIFFFGGVQCLFLGILGEYLSRVHIEVKHRPLWVVRETAGFPVACDPLGGDRATRERQKAQPSQDDDVLHVLAQMRQSIDTLCHEVTSESEAEPAPF